MAYTGRPRGTPISWRGELWPGPFEVQDEIGYVGPERQDKYEHYEWNHTVEEVVGTGLYRTDIPLNPLTGKDRRQIAALLGRLAVKPLAARRFLTLSYGERRLVLFARALASRPKLLLLDELLNGLDEINHGRAVRWLEGTSRAHACRGCCRAIESRTCRRAPRTLWCWKRDVSFIPGSYAARRCGVG